MKNVWKAVAISAVAVLTLGPQADAADDTTLTIDTVTPTGSTVVLAGKLALGSDARAQVQVGTDATGDDLTGPAPTGTDLVKASIGMNEQNKLVFTIQVSDPPSPNDSIAPTFSYLWALSINGEDTGRFLQASNSATGSKTYRLCTRDAAANTISCPTNLTGTMAAGVTTMNVTPAQLGAPTGSTIEAGALGGGTTCPSLCATWTPAVTFYNSGGDDMVPDIGYLVPGAVKVAVVPASTSDGAISFNTSATVSTTGGWSATVATGALVPGNEYKAAARTCFGTADPPTCVLSTSLFTA